MKNVLKVVGAPFEFNGLLWNDDPTRILKEEDYVQGSVLIPFSFNGVTVLDPTQLLKPIFWELTGYTSWSQVVEAVRLSSDDSWAGGLFNLFYNASSFVGRYGHLTYESWSCGYRFTRALDFIMDQTQVEEINLYYTGAAPGVKYSLEDSEEEDFFVLVPLNNKQDVPLVHVQVTSRRIYTYRQEVEPAAPDQLLPEVKAGILLNYSTDACSILTGFLHTPKDKGTEVYLGLELEVSTDIGVRELQHIVQHVEPKQEPFFVCKKDGSIDCSRTHAYEIVTVPMTPARMRQEFRTLFGKLEVLCKAKGKRLDDYFLSSEKNGLHIHISKKAFEGDTRELRRAADNWGSKFLAAFNSDFMNEIRLLKAIAKRTDYTQNSYCGLGSGNSRGRRVAYRVGAKHLDLYQTKYSPAHGNKSKTYEVRLFAGLVSIDHILCSIDIVEAMYYYTGCHGAPLCVRFADTFKKWLATQAGYRSLKAEILKK